MTTLRDSLISSIRALGVLLPGETPDANQIQDAMDAQNVMLGTLSPLIIYANTSEDLTLVVGISSYTIGTGGAFNTGRPTKILDSSYIRDSGYDYPLTVIDQAKYNRITDKSASGRPENVFYDPQYALGVLYFDYVPDATYTFHLVSEKPLTEITDLTAPGFSFGTYSNEYKGFLKWNTALVLAPEYPGAVSQPGFQIVVREAQKSLSTIMRINAARKVEEVRLDCPGVKDNNDGNIFSF